MTSKATIGGHRPLEVHGVTLRRSAQGRAVDGLGYGIGGEPGTPVVGTELGDGEAAAVDGDGGTHGHVVEYDVGADDQASAVAVVVRLAHDARLLNDAGEHLLLPRMVVPRSDTTGEQ